MQTTQTPNQASTGFSRKKIVFFLFLGILIAVSGCIFFINRNHYSPKIYDDEEQVLSLFENNFDDFEKFMDVIYQHKAFGEIFKKRSESHTSNYKEVKKYMSEEDFEIVESFWITFRPYYMGSGWIDFRVNQEVFSIKLFTCRDISEDQKEEYLTYCLQDADLKKLRSEGEWYCLIPNKEKSQKRRQIIHDNASLLEFVFSDFEDSLKKATRLAEILNFDINGTVLKQAKIENKNSFFIEVSVYDDSETKYYVIINRENGNVEEVYMGGANGTKIYGVNLDERLAHN